MNIASTYVNSSRAATSIISLKACVAYNHSVVLPAIMLYKSGLPMTPLDKAGALFYVFVVGVFAWGPGTGVAIYSIAESSDDVGGPFSCQCIAKQCST